MFLLTGEYFLKYNALPSKEALYIDLSNADINDEQFEECKTIIDEMAPDEVTRLEWLVSETEKFCQDRAMLLALTKALQICDNKDDRSAKGNIPHLLMDALGVSFDNHIGHDYFDNADDRFDFYHRKEDKVPFHIELLNRITKGGVSRKSLTILIMGTGVGKSLSMCDFAAANLQDGKNVLYITMEMSEERISQRIDANLMDVTVDSLLDMSRNVFDSNVASIKSKTVGKLVVKEYPTSTAGSANFRFLINELKIKKNFVPDIIYIDYLNICVSSRFKKGGTGMYEYVKSVAEELRGLAVEFNVPVFTATQFNRGGMKSSDPDMDNTSESIGIAFTADLILAGTINAELEKMGQIMFTQLKNRYGDLAYYKSFIVGIDKSKMKLYDVELKEQTLLDKAKVDKQAKELFVTPEMEKQLGKYDFDDFE